MHSVTSFGKQMASSGSLTNAFQYTGREFDSETGLYYYRARYYDPTTGRFISEDPSHFNAGVNFYSYVGNNPTDPADPLGLAPCPDKSKCPRPWLQFLFGTMIRDNPQISPAYWAAHGIAKATGHAVIVGVAGNATAPIWPEEMLGGSARGSIGLAVDPCGNIGIAVSGLLGGGYRNYPMPFEGPPVAYSGGGSFTYTHSPTIFGLNGSSPVGGVQGGAEYGGSVTHTLNGSTTVTAGVANGVSALGGVKYTKVFPLVCSMNCK